MNLALKILEFPTTIRSSIMIFDEYRPSASANSLLPRKTIPTVHGSFSTSLFVPASSLHRVFINVSIISELHPPRTTLSPFRHTEYTDRYGSKKQTDRRGKLHSLGRDGTLSKSGGNMGHSTPMLRRNNSNALTDQGAAKKSKVSVYPAPAPAPAPAHFPPTQLNTQNSVTSSRHCRLNYVELIFAFIVIVVCSS